MVDSNGAGLWEAARFQGDGYDRAAFVARFRWRPVASWGRDGWDLGDWPLVMVFFRERRGAFDLCVNCEGDAELRSFPTAAERAAHVDGVALFYWRALGNGPDVGGISSVSTMPAEYRGPFSWRRLELERVR